MNSESRSTKTSADIWHEIQDEKRSFRVVLRALIVLLAIAALIALGMFYYSYSTLAAQEARYTAEVRAIEIRNEIARGDAARERQNVLNRTLEIKEELSRAANATVFNDRARQVVLEGASQRDVDTVLREARLFTAGANLDASRFTLIEAVARETCEGEAPELPLEVCMFLDAVTLDWAEKDNRSPGSKEPSERLGVDTPPALAEAYERVIETEARSGLSVYTPYAHAGLAQLHYAYADNNQRGTDEDCRETVRATERADEQGFDGIGPYLLAGECLRKQGRPTEANLMFRKASDWYEAARATTGFDERRFPPDVFRLAYHGEGTTSIAMIASGQFSGDESRRTAALRTAERNLEIAADRRVARGEGEVGEVYTTENIGFIYVLEEDWPSALYHTALVNDVLPLAWNLVVRRIAAEALYENIASSSGPNAGLSTADAARDIACEAERLLLSMRYEYFDEEEILKLLPADRGYGKLISEIVELPKLEYERRRQAADARREALSAAYPTTGDIYYGTDFCRPEQEQNWLPF
ncbi:MAG: hypothetical protein AAF583_08635 [Pseudomonadota bacterium]